MDLLKSLFYKSQFQPTSQMVILITGCDSGIGFRYALEAIRYGFTVVAGFLSYPEDHAAQKMRELCTDVKRLHQIHLDITNDENISHAVLNVENLIKNKQNYFLHALINNAGIMIFGEFEWQSFDMINSQISVNVCGTMKITKAFLPLLRYSVSVSKFKPRLIVMGSHCGIQPLPTLSVYGATKYALKGWCEVIRMELKPQGIDVINFIPGSMVAITNITAKQDEYAENMKKTFTKEAWNYHGINFNRLQSFLTKFSFSKSVDAVQDHVLIDKLMGALSDIKPCMEYKHQPWRYAIYHFLFCITPFKIRFWLVNKFMSLPPFQYQIKPHIE